MNAIVLVVDRLHAGYVGFLGNSWVITPSLNRIAAEGFTFDQALVDMPSVSSFYRAAWTGTHAAQRPRGQPPAGPSLPERLASAGVATAVISDAPRAELDLPGEGVAEHLTLALPAQPVLAASPDETHLAGFFATAIDWLQSARPPFCLWLHAASLGTLWDAPPDFRNQYADTDEPRPPAIAAPPRLVLPQDYDPDELLGYVQSYAGQVSLFDQCLGVFLEYLEFAGFGPNTLLALVSPRGLALGEHRRVGAWDDALHGETVHVPWLFRFPDRLGAAARSQALVQPPDLHATLDEFWQLAPPAAQSNPAACSLLPLVRDDVLAVRDRAGIVSASGERGLRVPAWYLRAQGSVAVPGDSAASRWLYAKPDDRWEANDVAVRCPEVVELLEQRLEEWQQALRAGTLAELVALAPALVEEFR